MADVQELIKCAGCKKRFNEDGFSINRHNVRLKTCNECRTRKRNAPRCEHGRRRARCKDCGGGSICEHDLRRDKCKNCTPSSHLMNIVTVRACTTLKEHKTKPTIEYLGCPLDEFRAHIESLFVDGMNWANHGEWHIDHIIPLKGKVDGVAPTIEDIAARLHWTNTQPLWAADNKAKGNRIV